jgi:hypothetical protein
MDFVDYEIGSYHSAPSYCFRRYLEPKKQPQVQSEKLFGAIGYGIMMG